MGETKNSKMYLTTRYAYFYKLTKNISFMQLTHLLKPNSNSENKQETRPPTTVPQPPTQMKEDIRK